VNSNKASQPLIRLQHWRRSLRFEIQARSSASILGDLGTQISPVSQIATYWFVICWFDNQKTQKSEVRQVTKDVIKFEVYP